MSPDTAAIRARDRFLAEYQRRPGTTGPSWLSRLRKEAAERFAAIGFPGPKDEAWRFTNLSPVTEREFVVPPVASEGVPGDLLARVGLRPDAATARLVFLNGRFHRALSSPGKLPPGVRFGPLSEVLANGASIADSLGSQADLSHPFSALNTALFEDGAWLHVPGGVEVEQPLELVFLTGLRGAAPVVYPRTLMVLERAARATVLETYASLDGASLTCPVTEIVVGEAARLDHCRIQQQGDDSYHVAVTRSRQLRDSVLDSCSVSVGSSLVRHDIGAVMGGLNGSLTLNGLVLAAGQQHVDHATVIDHAEPHCESHELFNGIFDGRSRGVFTGRIIVRPGAQRTDSKQTSNNLLLSDEARADTQPQLEIYADDVKCTHGATLGPVDDASLFYLRSRGLGEREARALLTYGFGADIVARVKAPVVRTHLDQLLTTVLRDRGEIA